MKFCWSQTRSEQAGVQLGSRQSLHQGKTLLIIFWRGLSQGCLAAKPNPTFILKPVSNNSLLGIKPLRRIPGSPSLPRKLFRSPQIHEKKITFLPGFSITGTPLWLRDDPSTIFSLLIFHPYPQDSWPRWSERPSLYLPPARDNLYPHRYCFLRASPEITHTRR